MAVSLWARLFVDLRPVLIDASTRRSARPLSSVPAPVPKRAETAEPQPKERPPPKGDRSAKNPHSSFRFIYPEFLPDPQIENRSYIREKLERIDMLARRSAVDLPEFYVGSVLAVTVSEPHSPGKTSRFVGICIERAGCGLKHEFTLRNVVDHQGVEVRYNLYDPTIQKLQVLRLEKRLDDKLFYLRDAPLEHSTFDFDMEPEILPEGHRVPVNRIQIELKPRPWRERWEIQGLKGVVGLEDQLRPREKRWLERFAAPWEKYDLMLQYRKTIPEEEQNSIWTEVYSKLHELELRRKKASRKRVFNFPKKTA